MTTEFERVTAAMRARVGEPPDPKHPDFYTPQQWRARGERYGLSAVAIVVHDGGAFAPYFNPDYADHTARDEMSAALAALTSPEAPAGYFAEPCTSWYTAIYRA